MAYGAAKHPRKKIVRLVHPPPLTAPWLGPPIKIGRGRGRGPHSGRMYFEIKRRLRFPTGPGPERLDEKYPYDAKICIGRPGWERVAGGCAWGSGRTPTKALARAFKNFGTDLARGKIRRRRR